ncbi:MULTISPECIES: polysaccharide biosynthesis/export family protein [unclassified Dysgonomonas]|uniref:polysaccharide biosynthesis/export family protein n=1 Tax=unclassified Dysgonomonas TaxID=2630389 RepID=UPI000680322A|nr:MULTISPECIES: polysaccharide biosynthesis/export family protein [unclassified Dysgonomonas]MBD8346836.1 polysaccharide biosynthesis/export family protein [Dysgonomonas sp. HGC4]MBF0578157.1 polysaccharide biosynthesis/export family protein [Dysgonomonas sp. GY617]
MKRYHFLLFIGIIIFCSSCGTTKNFSYFQDLDEYLQKEVVMSDSIQEIRIKPDDQLAIVVSSVNPQAVTPFNLPVTGQLNPTQSPLPTYLVDSQGEINFPTLGKIRLAGLSLEEAVSLLQIRLEDYVKDPIVNIQILNFRVSVLGSVNAPGPFYFTGQRVSILDAIANARDLTLYGRRDNVLLIRENEGKKEFIRFDLTKSGDVFSSKYFYLQQNDIVYVESNKEHQKDAQMSQQKQFNLTLITTAITSVIATVSLIIAVSNK